MAQTGYTPLLIYSSSTVSQAPAAGNLTNSTLGSELAINITDGKLFYKDNANAVQVIAWKTTPTTAGGTGLTSYTAGDLLYYATGTALSKLAIGTAGNYLSSSGTAPQWSAPAALTKTDDTNVTLTLGGSASTALLNAASITVGWTGTLAVGRGGTGASTFTAGRILFGNGTSALNTSANLFWDNTNGRLGVNTSSPAYAADIRGGDLIVSRGTSAASDAAINFGSNGNNYIYSGNANNIMAFATNGSERQRIHASGGVSIADTTDPGAGNLRLGTGNLVIGTSGKGIDFSAAGGDILTTYDERTFTPTWNGGTVTVNSSNVTKIGRQVTWILDVVFGSSASGTDSQLTLPFTATGSWGGGSINFTDYGTGTTVNVDAVANRLLFRAADNSTNLSCASVATKRFICVVTYFA